MKTDDNSTTRSKVNKI